MADDCLELPAHGHPGKLIVFEGANGVGKSTTVDLARQALDQAGRTVEVTFQPTQATRESSLFLRYLYEPEERELIDYRALLALMLSDRLQHVHEVVLPALANGHDVLCDRYVFTMIASMRARNYDESWLIEACSMFPRPDVAVLLEAPLDVAEERVSGRSHRREAYFDTDLQPRMMEQVAVLAEDGHLQRIDSLANDPGAVAGLALDAAAVSDGAIS